ncbi:hypothetical protein C1645_731671 [Glomus cerebriforme]|uniref:Ion transport domain-containing protein n=1 Tax=Glomus cerebriforme TaxID=658196 RepID=A0A397TKJ7_9GLOM|nr:hypothetical protein C1645_731671 [Glomus cerebriforme]
MGSEKSDEIAINIESPPQIPPNNDKSVTINIESPPQIPPHNEKSVTTNIKSPPQIPPHNDKSVTRMAISPDSKFIVTYSQDDESFVSWIVDVNNDNEPPNHDLSWSPPNYFRPAMNFKVSDKKIIIFNEEFIYDMNNKPTMENKENKIKMEDKNNVFENEPHDAKYDFLSNGDIVAYHNRAISIYSSNNWKRKAKHELDNDEKIFGGVTNDKLLVIVDNILFILDLYMLSKIRNLKVRFGIYTFQYWKVLNVNVVNNKEVYLYLYYDKQWITKKYSWNDWKNLLEDPDESPLQFDDKLNINKTNSNGDKNEDLSNSKSVNDGKNEISSNLKVDEKLFHNIRNEKQFIKIYGNLIKEQNKNDSEFEFHADKKQNKNDEEEYFLTLNDKSISTKLKSKYWKHKRVCNNISLFYTKKRQDLISSLLEVFFDDEKDLYGRVLDALNVFNDYFFDEREKELHIYTFDTEFEIHLQIYSLEFLKYAVKHKLDDSDFDQIAKPTKHDLKRQWIFYCLHQKDFLGRYGTKLLRSAIENNDEHLIKEITEKTLEYIKKKDFLVRYGTKLLRSAIENNNEHLIKEIIEKTLEYFKKNQDLNIYILSIISENMNRLSHKYSDFLLDYLNKLDKIFTSKLSKFKTNNSIFNTICHIFSHISDFIDTFIKGCCGKFCGKCCGFCDLGAYLLPTITSIWILNDNTDIRLSPLISISCLLLDIKFLLFFRAFGIFGIYFAIIIGVGRRIYSFLFILFLIIISFAHSFLILLKPKFKFSENDQGDLNDPNNPWVLTTKYHQISEDGTINSNAILVQEPDENTNLFSSFADSLLAVYLFLIGDKNSLDAWTPKDNKVMIVLMVIFTFVIVVYLMNLFIGLLNNAIEKDNDRAFYLAQKAEILKDIELFYLLPYQRRKVDWFPDIIYYYANTSEIDKKLKKKSKVMDEETDNKPQS